MRGSEPHTRLSRLGVLHWEDESSESLSLKASEAYFWESQRVVRNRDYTLKGHIQNPTHSGTQDRGSNLKGPQILWKKRQEERQEQLELSLGT